jgi:GAF domain-containing protein
MAIPPGEVVCLTQAEVESHPLWQGFGDTRDRHPPMRGWLATSVCGEDGRVYGLLQLSDKSDGSDFTATDCAHVGELSALVGELLDALRLAAA